MPTKLILIRHGITEWNLKKRYCGFMDINLSEKGKKQAQRLNKRLKKENIPIYNVYSSDRKRALQTAKIVFKGFSVEKVSDLREMHFGVFEGLTYRQIIRKYPHIYRKWLDDPSCATIPGGENLSDFKKRVITALRKIIRFNRNKTVAVVSHGGAISIFLTDILKMEPTSRRRRGGSLGEMPKRPSVIRTLKGTVLWPRGIKDFWRYIPSAASLTIVEYKNGKPKIRLLNDTAHLNG